MHLLNLIPGRSCSFLVWGSLILAAPGSGLALPFGEPYILADESSAIIYDAGSHPGSFFQVGNITYFAAKSMPAGRELWRTDGTAAGTFMVKDINPAFADVSDVSLYEPSSNPESFVEFNGSVFFSATSAIGRELWRTDGTRQGTVLVKDINPGRANGVRGSFIIYQDNMYFAGNESAESTDIDSIDVLFKTDGTAGGTDCLRDNAGEPLIKDVLDIAVSNNKLYVATPDAVWVTDGTAEGSLEIPLPAGTLNPFQLTDVNGTIFFTVQEALLDFFSYAQYRELWKSDGTVAGTGKILDIEPASTAGTYIDNLVGYQGKLYFAAADVDDGPELWVSDGTEAGTHVLVNINPGSDTDDFGSFPDELTVVGNKLWFGADDGVSRDGNFETLTDPRRDPWITDGTAAGTRKVADLDNSDVDIDYKVGPRGFTFFNGFTYFIATHCPAPITGDPFSGEPIVTVFKSDGTEAGTSQVAENYLFDGYIVQGTRSDTAALFARPDMLLFNGGRGARVQNTPFGFSANGELWRSDGADAGTVLLKEIHAYPASGKPLSGFALNDMFYFIRNMLIDGDNFIQIYSSDGLAVTPLNTPGDVRSLWHNDKHMYFVSRQDSGEGTEYHIVAGDGAGGYENVQQIDSFFDVSYATPWGDRALFSRQKQSDDLWVTDGTASGTVKVFDQDINNIFNEVKVITPSLALIQNNPSFNDGPQLWRTDGTTTGTYMLGSTGGESDDMSRFAAVNGKGVFFTSMDFGGSPIAGGGMYGLAETDGTNEGTRTVIDGALFTDEANLPFSPMLGVVGDKMYFTYTPETYHEEIGEELWVYDQAQTTVTLVKDIWPGPAGAQISDLTQNIEYQGYFFFSANDGVHGKELWRTDGTEAGTVMVKDIDPGAAGSYPEGMVKVGEHLVFAANHPVAGYELYVLESADAEPQLVSDLNPGIQPSTPRNFVEVDALERVFFTADHNTAGTELWVLPTQPGQSPAKARLWELFE